ncbi:hypothetical protein DM01DRAFT_1332106 [Hesseltinella vesiculosa]|uniref:Bud22 domain-containing protein n=1 Tax=Hesseltinella vesiculosa TaxID=101127 RepID=A0A1X2GU41_9FUNG|nr:hypothetical protein DM01DRAFT_1332106 [Hesseltinella vesiculosa]
MGLKAKSGVKENLNWKINVLAAKVGEDSYLERAKIAAGGDKKAKDQPEDQQQLIDELNTIKNKKMEAKLFHIRKDLKAHLKKAKVMETQKQIKKVRQVRDALADKDTVEVKGKTYTKKTLEDAESQLEMIKNLDLEVLSEKALSKAIQKVPELKNNESLQGMLTKDAGPVDEVLSNIQANVYNNKVAKEPLAKSILELEATFAGAQKLKEYKDAQRQAKQKAKQQKTAKVTKSDSKPSPQDRPANAGMDSMFIESLGGAEDSEVKQPAKDSKKDKKKSTNLSADWVDKDFDKYYTKKEATGNRPGQRQRRMKWEAMYGKNAKHITTGSESLRDKQQKREKMLLKRRKEELENPAKKKKKTQAESLPQDDVNHPSWKAKRQEQHMISQALSGKAANKKTVFNDDD